MAVWFEVSLQNTGDGFLVSCSEWQEGPVRQWYSGLYAHDTRDEALAWGQMCAAERGYANCVIDE